MPALSATEVAFLQIAALQAVAAFAWALGSVLVRAERSAVVHWAVWAALSSATWFMLAATFEAPPLLAVVVGLCGAISLHRGIRLFVRRPFGWTLPALLLALVVAADALAPPGGWRPAQAAVNFGALCWLYAVMALDLRRHAREELRWALPTLLALPLLLGALAFGGRALRALLQPEVVLTEMAADSTLNVASAVGYVVLVLLLHATLAALVVMRLVARLQRLARRDALTGLLNRRAMHELLDQQAARSRRASDHFAVLLLDLDHFKPINDQHGHEVGDRALAHAAQRLAQALRPEYRLGRLGGDEFVALLPGCDAARAAAEAERLRDALRDTPLECAGLVLTLSVSIGVAQSAGAGEDVARLLARADAALLAAKRAGRGRVHAAAEPVAAARPQPQAR
jgi:diguanylate cyclase (GGDEF)-like protein